MGEFDNRVALVTAAASGIGKTITLRLSSQGARVLASDINRGALDELKNEAPGEIETILTDVSHETQIATAVRHAAERWGGLDIGINVAGIGRPGLIVDAEVEDWDLVQTVTLRSTFLCIKHQARQFIAQHIGGAIVNISSINALTAARASPPATRPRQASSTSPRPPRSNSVATGSGSTPSARA
jgi:NAD(P)-dependent dehydrogenase (short-subunit alcohol dehydrogenase family)